MRRALSSLSMVAGAVLMVGGLGIRGGVLGAELDPSPRASAEPTPPPSVLVQPTVEPSIEPTAEASIDGGLFFADSFDAVAAWPTGQQEFVALDYDAGRYRLRADPTDLPIYIPAATGGDSVGPRISVEATVWLPDEAVEDSSRIGLVVGDGSGTRLVLVLDAAGHVALLRDSIESLDLLASGSVAPGAGARHLLLALEPKGAAAFVDGLMVAGAASSLEAVEFGLAIWAAGPVTFWADDFEVRIIR